MNIFWILLFIAVFLGQVIRIPVAPSVSLTPLDLLAGFSLVLVVGKSIREKHLPSTSITKPILFVIGACLLSLLFALTHFTLQQVGVGSLYLLRWIAYASIFFLVTQTKQLTRLPFYMLGSGMILAIGGFFQFVWYSDLINLFYLGWDKHWYRLFATFFDPNFLGVYFVVCTLLGLYLLIQTLQKKIYLMSGIYGVCILVLVTAVFFTFSRTALLSLLVGLFVFGLMQKQSRKIIGSIAIFCVVGIGIILLNYQATEGTKLFRTVSSFQRLTTYTHAWDIFQKSPLVGVGFNTYRYAQHQYGYAIDSNWEDSHSDAGSDNSFLFILATTGIVGLSSFLFLLFCMVRTKHPLVVASIAAIIFGSFFVNAFFYPAIMVWLWCLVGATENRLL